jgi:hypothetical protein
VTDPLLASLEAVLADPKARPSTKVNAAKELARLRGREPEPVDPLGVMQSIVEQWCPQTADERGVAPRPMRSLDYETFTGEKPDPLAMSWLPYCPDRRHAQQAARQVVAASRRLGVGQGPYSLPEDDDLSRRRRSRRTG